MEGLGGIGKDWAVGRGRQQWERTEQNGRKGREGRDALCYKRGFVRGGQTK